MVEPEGGDGTAVRVSLAAGEDGIPSEVVG
jgi:hypothetical protein